MLNERECYIVASSLLLLVQPASAAAGDDAALLLPASPSVFSFEHTPHPVDLMDQQKEAQAWSLGVAVSRLRS